MNIGQLIAVANRVYNEKDRETLLGELKRKKENCLITDATDSLGVVELVLLLENELEISIPDHCIWHNGDQPDRGPMYETFGELCIHMSTIPGIDDAVAKFLSRSRP